MADALDTLIDRAARGVLLRSEGPALRAAVAAMTDQVERYKQHILDIDAHATPYGVCEEDPEGSPRAYLITVGSLHRALGTVGHSAAKCDAEAQIAAVRALHRDEYGLCAECTNSHGVPWPCPTITAIDGPAAPAAVKAMPLVAVAREDVEDWALCAPAERAGRPERLMVKKVTSWTAGCWSCRQPVAACACLDGPS